MDDLSRGNELDRHLSPIENRDPRPIANSTCHQHSTADFFRVLRIFYHISMYVWYTVYIWYDFKRGCVACRTSYLPSLIRAVFWQFFLMTQSCSLWDWVLCSMYVLSSIRTWSNSRAFHIRIFMHRAQCRLLYDIDCKSMCESSWMRRSLSDSAKKESSGEILCMHIICIYICTIQYMWHTVYRRKTRITNSSRLHFPWNLFDLVRPSRWNQPTYFSSLTFPGPK